MAITSSPAGAEQEELIRPFPVPVAYVESLGEITGASDGGIWFARYDKYLNPLERLAPDGTRETFGSLFSARPIDLTPGPAGAMWFISAKWLEEEPGEEMVQLGRMSATGAPSYRPIPQPTSSGEWSPTALTEGAEGSLWLAEVSTKAGEAVFARIPSYGAVTYYTIPSGEEEDEAQQSVPVALVAGAEGDIWFTDNGHNKLGQNLVGRMTPTGDVREFPIPTANSKPLAIAVSTSGEIWFTENTASKVGRVSPSGTVMQYAVPPLAGGPRGITRGPQGTMWFTTVGPESGIGWISPSGAVHTVPSVLLNGGQPISITTGAEGDPWYLDAQPVGQYFTSNFFITQLRVPSTPTPTMAPQIAGTASVGSLLTATNGSWTEDPTTLSDQWERCGAQGNECVTIPGATSESHFLDDSDAGHTLRALVTASNLISSGSSLSAPTAVVKMAAISPPSTLSSKPVPAYTPTMGVTMSWLPVVVGRATRFALLIAHGLRAGTTVALSCTGRGCPFRREVFVASNATTAKRRCARKCRTRHQPWVTPNGELSLTPLVVAARLRRGASLTVRFAKPGWFGQSYELSIGARHAITVRHGCLAPGSLVRPTSCRE